MVERMQELKNMFNAGITKELFFKLILHVQDDLNSNGKLLHEWYTKAINNKLIVVTDAQKKLFLDYMCNHYPKYFKRQREMYLVDNGFLPGSIIKHKSLINEHSIQKEAAVTMSYNEAQFKDNLYLELIALFAFEFNK